MIVVTKLNNGIYVVTEHIFSAIKTHTKSFYYDMEKLLISERVFFPDNELTRKLTNIQVEWFNRYYLPLAKRSDSNG